MGVTENDIQALPRQTFPSQIAYRLVNGKYPPIAIFDDVADQADFDALFAVQALTNPRLQNEVGDQNRVPPAERPWGIPGCNYALGPFVHVNPAGSRFSDGAYGVFYCADRMATGVGGHRPRFGNWMDRGVYLERPGEIKFTFEGVVVGATSSITASTVRLCSMPSTSINASLTSGAKRSRSTT